MNCGKVIFLIYLHSKKKTKKKCILVLPIFVHQTLPLIKYYIFNIQYLINDITYVI